MYYKAAHPIEKEGCLQITNRTSRQSMQHANDTRVPAINIFNMRQKSKQEGYLAAGLGWDHHCLRQRRQKSHWYLIVLIWSTWYTQLLPLPVWFQNFAPCSWDNETNSRFYTLSLRHESLFATFNHFRMLVYFHTNLFNGSNGSIAKTFKDRRRDLT
jgi:hypothetical protein